MDDKQEYFCGETLDSCDDNTTSEITTLSKRPDFEAKPRISAAKHCSGSRRQKEKTLINDEFTKFSQFGSRFMLNQTGEKNKKTNFVDHLQENKIFKKVASTCQKHYKKRTSQEQTERQKTKDSDIRTPVALPRCKKPPTEENKLVKPTGKKSSYENFQVAQVDLSDSVSESIPSINSTGKTLRHPGGSYKLSGSSTKSDSGFSSDTHVGDLRIKQVDIHADYELVQLLG